MKNRLRLHRALKGDNGVTQYDVSQALGLHRDRYWRIEKGYTDPTDDERAALAEYFGVGQSALFPLQSEAVSG